MTAFATTLQLFFAERLAKQRQASPRTVASYRTGFQLLLRFVQDQTGKAPSALDWDDLNHQVISAFLDHLENGRGNSARSRNARLAAVRSLFRYAALRHPEHAQLIQQVLAIPQKRFDRVPVAFLDRMEIDALLAAPDRTRWEGRRDHTLIAVAIQTGLRLSELLALNCSDLHLGPSPYVRCTGKGRKQRCVPLTTATAAVARVWLQERGGTGDHPVFPTRSGRRLSDDAVERRIAIYSDAAAQSCPSLATKTVTPHTLRHSTAMSLLHAGVDTAVIALWLGHADTRSTSSNPPARPSQAGSAPQSARPRHASASRIAASAASGSCCAAWPRAFTTVSSATRPGLQTAVAATVSVGHLWLRQVMIGSGGQGATGFPSSFARPTWIP